MIEEEFGVWAVFNTATEEIAKIDGSELITDDRTWALMMCTLMNNRDDGKNVRYSLEFGTRAWDPENQTLRAPRFENYPEINA